MYGIQKVRSKTIWFTFEIAFTIKWGQTNGNLSCNDFVFDCQTTKSHLVVKFKPSRLRCGTNLIPIFFTELYYKLCSSTLKGSDLKEDSVIVTVEIYEQYCFSTVLVSKEKESE